MVLQKYWKDVECERCLKVMKDKLNQFVEIVTNNGKIVSRRLNRDYFLKIGKHEIFDFFVEHTKFMNDTLVSCVKYIREGYYDALPKCHCGNDIRVLDRKVSKYCCAKCAVSSNDRIDKLKLSLSRTDKESSNKKRIDTMIKKYGVAYNSQRKDVKHLLGTKLPDDVLKKLNDRDWLIDQYVTNRKTSVQIAKELGIKYYGTVIQYLLKYGVEIRHHSNTSSIENEVKSYIESFGYKVENNVVGLLDDKREVDLYVKDKKLAIEINGLFYHSEKYKERNYHRNKKDDLNNKGIDLIQLTDYDWNNKKDIICSIISNRLGNSKRIFARNTIVKKIAAKDAREFLNDNHIKGYISAKEYWGLFLNGVCVMMISIDLKDEQIYISRSCSLLFHSIIGGFNKLLKHIIKTHKECSSVFSYVDKDYFNGSSYSNWNKLKDTDVGYFWTNGNDKISRYKCQNLSWLKCYDKNLTEVENMHNSGYYRYWNSGNYRYILDIKK